MERRTYYLKRGIYGLNKNEMKQIMKAWPRMSLNI